jgi:hypothetical protein
MNRKVQRVEQFQKVAAIEAARRSALCHSHVIDNLWTSSLPGGFHFCDIHRGKAHRPLLDGAVPHHPKTTLPRWMSMTNWISDSCQHPEKEEFIVTGGPTNGNRPFGQSCPTDQM